MYSMKAVCIGTANALWSVLRQGCSCDKSDLEQCPLYTHDAGDQELYCTGNKGDIEFKNINLRKVV